ncbi:MAG: GvpL/GvpF family gas vesicle protein [Bacteroidota bacterium]|nr:GvpL/GvpF family gas vesicle protein [Bacteroidota bacterium]
MVVTVDEGKYIYCIIDDGKVQTFGPRGIGGRGDELYTICFQDIGAVVSNSPLKRYPVLSENYLSHEKAIEEVMKHHTVLPVRFCTIAEDEVKVKKILEKEYDRFVRLLKSIQGKKELGLKAVFKEEVIYNFILDKYKDIRTFKEKIASKPQEATYYLRIEISTMVESALEKEKVRCKEEILKVLEPLAEETVINKTIGDRMVINAAFLVKEFYENEFDAKVNELDDRYSNLMKFKYAGSLPPFNFINLTINMGEY